MTKNSYAEAVATAEWRAGYRPEALAILAECGYAPADQWEFLTGRLAFGSQVAWSLLAKFAA
jgi:hypothetical protein